MLEGSLWDKLILVVLPFAFAGIMQQLFNAADIAMIGQFVGKEAMAAVGSNSPIIACLISLFMGISIGANVVISRFMGKQNIQGVHDAVHTAILVSVLSGVIIVASGEMIASPLLQALAVPPEIMDMAVLYLRLFLLSMPFMLIYNFQSAIFRSQGDTRTPLYCMLISGVVKFLLNLFFICVLEWGIVGVGCGTILASVLSAGLMFYYMYKSPTEIRLRLQELHIHKRMLLPMLRIGVPAGMQGMVFCLSNICIQSAINSLGADVMAATTAAFNFEIFIFFIFNAYGQVCTTFTSQNYGARNFKRCRQVFIQCLAQSLFITMVCSVIFLYFGISLLQIFNTDSAVVSLGYIRLTYVVGPEVLNVPIDVISGAMRGYGSSLIPAIITFVGICGLRIIWVYTYFAAHPTFANLMLVFPVSWFVTTALLFVAYLWCLSHVKKE